MTDHLTRRALVRGVAGVAGAGVLGAASATSDRDARRSGDGSRIGDGGRSGDERGTDGSATGASWPTFALDAANTAHAPDRSGPVEGAAESWSVPAGGPVQSSPVVADGTVFFGADDGTVSAVTVGDGTEQWTYETGLTVKAAPTVADGTVYVGSDDGSVYALDAAEGSERWVFDDGFDAFRTPTAVVDGTVYVGRDDGGVYALDAADGSEQWTYDTGGFVRAAPAVADDAVYVANDAGTVAAIDAANGDERWVVETPDMVRSAPAVGDGTVYVGGDDGRLRALDATSGDEQWFVEYENGIRSSPAVANGTVYAATNRLVTARDADSGDERWTASPFRVPRSPVVVGDHLYVGTGYRVACLQRDTGAVSWAIRPGTAVTTAPAVSGGQLFFGTLDAHLRALEPVPSTPTPTDSVSTHTATATPTDSGSVRDPTGTTVTGSTPDATATAPGSTGDASTTDGTAAGGTGSTPAAIGETTASDRAGTGETNGGDRGSDVSSGDALPVGGLALALALGTLGVGGLSGGYLWRRRDGDGSTEGQSAAVADDSGEGPDETAGRDAAGGGVDLGDVSLSGTTPSVGGDDDVSTFSLEAGPADDRADPSADRGDPSLRVAGPSADWTSGDWPVPETVPGEAPLDVAYEDIDRGESLGSGGQGTVYRATVGTGERTREFALKELRVDPERDADGADVLRRAETWAALAEHDHVVDVVDWGAEPVPWILTEYVGGGHLGRRAGTLDVAQALWVAVGVVRAVRHAHRRGVAHFDLKPANVLFERVPGAWDVPKVADWGLSRRLLAHSGTVEGFSPRYAAPEQVDDGFGDPDERTDVYGLGAVCYALFTGRPPYTGSPASVVREIVAESSSPPPPSDVADVPRALGDIVETAMAREKRDRYESVLYLRDDLVELAQEY